MSLIAGPKPGEEPMMATETRRRGRILKTGSYDPEKSVR